MGVNSWNAFHCNVDERKMRAMADAVVSTGLAKAGYEYLLRRIFLLSADQLIEILYCADQGYDLSLKGIDSYRCNSFYRYINIDDCWQVMRSPNGTINSDPERFPGGMKALADYIHSRGLKFGVCAYYSVGTFSSS